jgi:hypothetical protein
VHNGRNSFFYIFTFCTMLTLMPYCSFALHLSCKKSLFHFQPFLFNNLRKHDPNNIICEFWLLINISIQFLNSYNHIKILAHIIFEPIGTFPLAKHGFLFFHISMIISYFLPDVQPMIIKPHLGLEPLYSAFK